MEERRKRSKWPWIVLALIPLYPLSTGPAMRYALTTNGDHSWMSAFYTPVWEASKVASIQKPLLWYFNAWMPSPYRAIPHPQGVEFAPHGRPASD